jgi:hypothetical protein
MRIVDNGDIRRQARMNDRARHIQKWTPKHPSPARHAGQTPSSRAASQPEENGFSLIIKGLSEQNNASTEAQRSVVERAISSIPSGGLHPITVFNNDHALNGHRIKTPVTQDRSRALGNLVRARLQPMIDDDGPNPLSFQSRGQGKGHRIRPTRTGHKNEVGGINIGEFQTNRPTNVDNRISTHASRSGATRRHHACGLRTSARVGSDCALDQTRLNPSRPTSLTTVLTNRRPSEY